MKAGLNLNTVLTRHRTAESFAAHTDGVPEQALRLYPTEAAAKKAGLHLASFDGSRLGTVLYRMLPAGEKKATYLLSSTYRLTVAERRWVMEHQAEVTKLGRFPVGGSYMPLQTNMLRPKKKPTTAEADTGSKSAP